MNRRISFSNVANFVFFVFVSALFIFFSDQPLNIHGQAQKFDKGISSEEYKVYSCVIKSEVGNDAIVIDEKTSIPAGADFLGNPNESGLEDSNKNYQADEDAIKNFHESNAYNFTLENKFSVKNKVIFYTQKQNDGIFERAYRGDDKPEPHEIFKKEFNRSTAYIFSRVGFNKDKTKALLVVFTWCGSLCGEGSFIFLEKENQNWIVKRKNTKVVA